MERIGRILIYVLTKYLGDNYWGIKCMFFGRFVRTFELAIYTTLLLALGGSNHGGKRGKNYFGIGGNSMCHTNKKINLGAVASD
jgi:hypothetical protein